jgi:hypothetical protein
MQSVNIVELKVCVHQKIVRYKIERLLWYVGTENYASVSFLTKKTAAKNTSVTQHTKCKLENKLPQEHVTSRERL